MVCTLVCRQPFDFICVISHTDWKDQTNKGDEFKLIVTKTTHQSLALKTTQGIHFAFLLLFFLPSLTNQNHLLFKLLSNSLASKRVSFDSSNPEKVTGIKKIDGMSQEDLKLY